MAHLDELVQGLHDNITGHFEAHAFLVCKRNPEKLVLPSKCFLNSPSPLFSEALHTHGRFWYATEPQNG